MFLKCGSAQTSYRPIKFIASFDDSNKHSLCCLPATNLTKLSMTLLDVILSGWVNYIESLLVVGR